MRVGVWKYVRSIIIVPAKGKGKCRVKFVSDVTTLILPQPQLTSVSVFHIVMGCVNGKDRHKRQRASSLLTGTLRITSSSSQVNRKTGYLSVPLLLLRWPKII